MANTQSNALPYKKTRQTKLRACHPTVKTKAKGKIK